MNKTLAGVTAALMLCITACGIEGASDDASVDSSGSAVVDDPAGEEWEDDLGTEDDGSESGVTERDGSEESDEPDESDESDGSDGSDSADGASGGVTPGVYVAPDGAVENGYDLRFEVSEDGSVLHSLEADVLESCDDTSTSRTVTVGADLAWDIVDGQFSQRYEGDFGGGTVYTTLEGSFSGTTASGTIRQESVVAGSVCDTYALEFTAELR